MKYLKMNRKGCMITSCILFIVLLILTGSAFHEEGAGGNRWLLAVLLATAASLLILADLPFKKAVTLLELLVIPGAAMVTLQSLTCDVTRMYRSMAVVNCVFFYLFYLLISFLLGSFRWGYIISTILTMALGITNYFVVEFRGSPLVPWDLMSLGTAANVADNYSYSITWKLLFGILIFALLAAASFQMVLRPKKPVIRIPGAILSIVLLLACGAALQKKEVKNWLGMDQTLFTPNVRYRNNGFAAAFVGNLNLINIEQPEHYSVDNVLEIQDGIHQMIEDRDKGSSGTNGGVSSKPEEYPNIIVVMVEAFADLSYLGEFDTNEDYMPFMHSLIENGNGGQMMVSVRGGNTSNTEYEFLSGDTMAFLPGGSVVYQQYIHDEVPTMATWLKQLGYSTTGIHPYLGSGWDRKTVYPMMGFEEFIDVSDFDGAKKIRDYVSDEAAVDKIIEVFEEKKDQGPAFIFEVTMQNHSGYSKDYPGFEPTVMLESEKVSHTGTQVRAVDKYLTLVQESDKALERLVRYFETVEEPTILVMFGDHQPSDYITNVITRLTGYDAETSLEENQKSYLVPYAIWSNYDLGTEAAVGSAGVTENDKKEELTAAGEAKTMTSANYLGAEVLRMAGVPLADYHEFLLKMKERLPVIAAGAYIDSEGTYRTFTDPDEVNEKLLNGYQILQYNHLTDRKNRVMDLFMGMQ